MRTRVRAAVVALVILAIALPVAAQTKLKFAHVYETSEAFHVEALWAAGEIAKRTNNTYQIDVFPASALGNEQQISQALPLGTIDMAYLGASFIGAIHKPFSIVNVYTRPLLDTFGMPFAPSGVRRPPAAPLCNLPSGS